ncbi:histidinol-phosphatase [Cedecea neteri]|uniref:Histidinol-phosphatase n=1 Tax=Cedecea neteri TaxID=158822 RepID=A0A2X3JCE1_9ENTR|nr:histidinol-phosphatase [Cedecea neteri]
MTEQQQQALCTLIREAGARAQALRDAGLSVEKKGRQDFVSQADILVEQEIKNWLKAHCPQDGFLGEESGLVEGDSGVWVLDPVDARLTLFWAWTTGASPSLTSGKTSLS